MKTVIRSAAFVSLLSCAGAGLAADVSGTANIELHDADVSITFGSDGQAEGGSASHGSGARIPPGHRPPPGQCRLWYHDREPGQQPPPGNCKKLRKKVPRGASLIRG